MAREQHAEFLEAFANGGNRLRQLQAALAGPPGGNACGSFVGCIDLPAGEHIGAWREACSAGAARHQHFDAGLGIAQQQHGGCRAHGRWLACGVELLGGTDHAAIMERSFDAVACRISSYRIGHEPRATIPGCTARIEERQS
jgi:hypothetical protein